MKTTGLPPKPHRILQVRQRHDLPQIHLPQLRKILLRFLNHHLGLTSFELGIHLVREDRMTHINQHFLQHEGSTDVITFDYRDDTPSVELAGECYICPAVAMIQAGQFGSSYPEEILRYCVHAILHLRGYDDLEPVARRKMKIAENRWIKTLSSETELTCLLR
ncbi:MAG: rRNA maturation RNase YbeY [Limisphaerales bacterium]